MNLSAKYAGRDLAFCLWAVACPFALNAQELFNLAENASNIPKGTLGVRAFSEAYREYDQWRNMNALRLMYGATPRLSVYLTATMSNHHKTLFPVEYPYHNTPERGVHKPYRFNGFNLYAKYRFLSVDAPHQHFRMAAYGLLSTVKTAHDEGEPRLLDDNKGWGAGLISTYLKHKFSVSATLGMIYPWQVKGSQPDAVATLPDIPTRVIYGKALEYSLSFGYLMLPKHYNSYKQLNINAYLEFEGRYYGATKVYVAPYPVPEYYIFPFNYPPALKSGAYVEVSPGIQLIINSNTRIDLSGTFRFVGFSYQRLYPQLTLGFQHYFYL